MLRNNEIIAMQNVTNAFNKLRGLHNAATLEGADGARRFSASVIQNYSKF